ncbi:hypothetical protein CBR_g10920 [Chara braunii]|uniref:BED-type domain-containing protein n=1 Tax=Chara braunii TaxID=69332 RepID=A0A388KPL8_CHABU|nr:hypothetical protein CBR_g10920 [Chara braunii]|eukprot:GBG71982.1 hypothetical protein CBR_g10920 [Chara braunii]
MSNDVAGQLFTYEYCNAKIKGKPSMKPTKQSLSCFDQTLPVSVSRRAGAHQKIIIPSEELPYYSAGGVYRYRGARKTPQDYTRKGDGERIKRGELTKELPKPEPPVAGAYQKRDNPPNTLFRKFYERGDLPIAVEHRGAEFELRRMADKQAAFGGRHIRDIGGGSGGSGRRRGKTAAEKGKEKLASTSTTPTSTVTSKDPTPAMDPSLFVPQDKARQDKLQREKPVWKYAEQGQEAGVKGRGEYWVRCRLCMQIWRGTSSRVVEHYLKTQKPCPSRTGEMVNELVNSGGKVLPGDKNTRYLLKNYRQLHGIPKGGVNQTEKADEVVEVPAYLEPQPPPTVGRAAPPCDAGDLHKENALEAAGGEAAGSNTVVLIVAVNNKEVRFGSVYQMLERIYDRRAVLKDMVNGRNAVKWNAIRWSTSKLRAILDLVYFTLRSDEWWTGLNKVVEVMEPVYGLLRRMDQDGTGPTNLVEYDDMIERNLSHVVLTVEQRASVMEKVKDRMKMMRQPAHATAFLLDPRRREPRWLHDQDSALVQNTMRFLSRQVGGEWKGQAHLDIWSDLNEFHTKPTRNDPKRNDTKMWDPTAKADVDKKTPSELWAAHGGDVPELQKVAIKVIGMWSTASPAERNWASMDYIHSKRRNKLSPERLAKLVYIHWNMQLLRVPETKNNGFVDLWCDFVEPAPEPEENDGSVSKGPEDEAEKTEEELVRERRLTKTSKGRVPKNLEDKDEELTDDSDLDDELWKGKCGLSEDSSGSEEDDDDDSDFELRPEPSVPGTTYIGRRWTRRQRREEPRPTATEPEVRETALYNPQSDVEFARLETDVETLLETRVDEDEEDANRAKAMADRETELVNKRMMEEARRAAIPTRREIERGLKQAREHQQQINQALEVEKEGEEEEEHQAEVGDYMEQEEEAEGMVQPQEIEEMEHQEEEEGAVQGGEEEEMQQEEEGEGLAQQKMQHGEVDTAREDEPHPTATAV